MGCFWAYFLFSRIAQTMLGVGILVLLVHGLGGIAILFVCLLVAGYVTGWRVRSREVSPYTAGGAESFTASEHVSRETAYIPWRREVKAFSMAPLAGRLMAGELIGIALGVGVLLLAIGTIAWLDGLLR